MAWDVVAFTYVIRLQAPCPARESASEATDFHRGGGHALAAPVGRATAKASRLAAGRSAV